MLACFQAIEIASQFRGNTSQEIARGIAHVSIRQSNGCRTQLRLVDRLGGILSFRVTRCHTTYLSKNVNLGSTLLYGFVSKRPNQQEHKTTQIPGVHPFLDRASSYRHKRAYYCSKKSRNTLAFLVEIRYSLHRIYLRNKKITRGERMGQMTTGLSC
jgi:hypothetical protein